MHRVAPNRTVLGSSSVVRAFSTPPPSTPRKPLLSWGNISIPSREEVKSIQAKKQTDINYLKFENQKSLAARLARPTIDITLQKQAEAKKGIPVAKEQPESTKSAAVTPTPSQLHAIEEITKKRREARIERERLQNELKQRQHTGRDTRSTNVNETKPNTDPTVSTSSSEGPAPPAALSDADAEERRAHVLKVAMELAARRKADRIAREMSTNVNERKPNTEPTVSTSSSEGPAPPAALSDADAEERRARVLQLAMELAARRKADRIVREMQNPVQTRQPIPRKADVARGPGRRPNYIANHSHLNDLASNDPEFTGPEEISSDLLGVYQSAAITSQNSTSVHGGNYSAFVPLKSRDFATPPNELGVEQLAKLTLSHRRDISLPSREHTIDLITAALTPKAARKTT